MTLGSTHNGRGSFFVCVVYWYFSLFMLAMIYVYIVDLYLVYKHEAAAILPTAVKITISPKCQISNLK